MQQILKRLELIKTSIAIEDQEIIELQIFKLSSMAIDEDVQRILGKLSNNDYGSVVIDIENYIARFSGVVMYEDKELGGLKMELKVLEGRLQELSEEKNEYLGEIHDFNIQYNLHLGEVIRKILELKKEILYKKTLLKRRPLDNTKKCYEKTQEEVDQVKDELSTLKKQLDEMDSLDDAYDDLYEEFKRAKDAYKEKVEDLIDLAKEIDDLTEELEGDSEFEEYQDANNEYESFNSEYEEIINEDRYELSDEELIELKKLYRKASKLCHPDVVEDELKEQALILMQELNEAYGKKDLKRVKEILSSLENGAGFVVGSERINDKEMLRAKIEELRMKINEVNHELEEIKSDETFITIQELDEWDEYFDQIKNELNEEQERLAEQVNTLSADVDEPAEKPLQKTVTKQSDSEDDEYWNSEF